MSVRKTPKLEKPCMHCSFDDDDIFRQERFEELEKDSLCSLFRFNQKGKCYCFCVADLYKWIYGSLDLGEEITRDTNPKTQKKIKRPTLDRLKKEYENYYRRIGKTTVITDRERQDFLDGIHQFRSGFETIHQGLKIPLDKVVSMYMDDLKEILDPEEYARQVVIADTVLREGELR